ncbi:hypothetical protein [Carboxylicivirga sp. N1Y90]|uniref:hypothetical protein n=1 Tax=Carboxylicivirga fragile TaxID=3417571 RepID=UPI003D350CF1|nr:hypothetical protein [Marinilabiliaceae bacterium N1Y90]
MIFFNKEILGIKMKYLIIIALVFLISKNIFDNWDNFKRGLNGDTEVSTIE